jgi:hypothetical protein
LKSLKEFELSPEAVYPPVENRDKAYHKGFPLSRFFFFEGDSRKDDPAVIHR